MGRPKATAPNKPLAIFATFMIVVGVAAAVYLSSQFPARQLSPVSLSNATSTNDPRRLILVNTDGITILGLDGKTERSSLDAFRVMYPYVELTNGVDAANGAPITTSTGAVSPDGKYIAKLQEAQKDGASVIAFTRLGSPATKQVLRENKLPIADASIYGWFNDRMLMVVGRTGDVQKAYRVTVGEGVTALMTLPENVVALFARGGALWYVTAKLGEGIESSPTGPSELHRIVSDGEDMTLAHEKDHVFVSVVPGRVDNVFAYTVDNGQSFITDGPAEISRQGLDMVRPLLFTSNGNLVARNGFDVVLIDYLSATMRTIGKLPAGGVSIFYADSL